MNGKRCACRCCVQGLSRIEMDEWLIWYVQDYKCRAARDLLCARCDAEVRALVARLCRAADLQDADVADVQQETFFAVDRAMDRYDLARLGGTPPCHFRTFLHHLVVNHVCNVLRRRWRARLRDGRVRREAARALGASTPRGAVHWLACAPDWGGEPSLAAEQAEALADLRQAVVTEGGEKGGLWEGLLAGSDPETLARQRGCSASTVRRERGKMVSRLGASLRDHRG